MDSELHDECGVFGYFCPDETKTDAARHVIRFICVAAQGSRQRRHRCQS